MRRRKSSSLPDAIQSGVQSPSFLYVQVMSFGFPSHSFAPFVRTQSCRSKSSALHLSKSIYDAV